LKIVGRVLDEIRAHAAEGYPYEVCGVLIGRADDRQVIHSRRMTNAELHQRETRYRFDDLEHIRVQRAVDELGLEIVGYYHSHPDHPAIASETDANDSWAGPFYLIVASHKAGTGDANVFVANQDHGSMRREPLEII
jgi:proteasome lid subunit RPN8/RPN11